MTTPDISPANVLAVAALLSEAWRSQIVARNGDRNIKVIRMGAEAVPTEVHDYEETFLVLEGRMELVVDSRLCRLETGEIYTVPAGVSHAVGQGSSGILLLIDR